MSIKEYMRTVVKMCDSLEMVVTYFGDVVVVDKEKQLVIGAGGCFNFSDWNNKWLSNNITEFHEATSISDLNVQTIFHDPQEFVKFYKKVLKEIGNVQNKR